MDQNLIKKEKALKAFDKFVDLCKRDSSTILAIVWNTFLITFQLYKDFFRIVKTYPNTIKDIIGIIVDNINNAIVQIVHRAQSDTAFMKDIRGLVKEYETMFKNHSKLEELLQPVDVEETIRRSSKTTRKFKTPEEEAWSKAQDATAEARKNFAYAQTEFGGKSEQAYEAFRIFKNAEEQEEVAWNLKYNAEKKIEEDFAARMKKE